MRKIKLSLIGILLYSASALSAMQFQTVGYKSVSMGGAAVANSSSSMSSYNNPALLAKSKYDVEISISGGASLYDNGAGASMQSLEDTNFIDSMDRISTDINNATQQDINNIYAGKDVIIGMNNDSFQISPQAAVGIQAYGFGFGIFGTSDVVVTAKVSQTHNKMIFEDTSNPGTYKELNADGTTTNSTLADYQAYSMDYAIQNGLDYGLVKGIGIAEVPLSYAYTIPYTKYGNIYVGGSVKYMKAKTYIETVKIDDSTDNSSVRKDATSNSFGVDLGLAYEPSFVNGMTIGLVGKNLNTPEFDVVDGTKVKVKPMIRMGVAYDIFDSLEVAGDVDLTSNETFVEGVKNQMIGGGLNWHPASWFSARGGLMSNLDSSDKSGVIYTAGLGFGLKWFQLDVSGQVSSKMETVNGTTYPRNAKVNVALISRW